MKDEKWCEKWPKYARDYCRGIEDAKFAISLLDGINLSKIEVALSELQAMAIAEGLKHETENVRTDETERNMTIDL